MRPCTSINDVAKPIPRLDPDREWTNHKPSILSPSQVSAVPAFDASPTASASRRPSGAATMIPSAENRAGENHKRSQQSYRDTTRPRPRYHMQLATLDVP